MSLRSNRRAVLESIGPCTFFPLEFDSWLIGRTEKTAHTPEGYGVYEADDMLLDALAEVPCRSDIILYIPAAADMSDVWDAARNGANLIEHLNDAVAGRALGTPRPRLVYDYGKALEIDGMIREGQDPYNDKWLRRVMELDMGPGSPILASLPFRKRPVKT